jgi:hypothetical protein
MKRHFTLFQKDSSHDSQHQIDVDLPTRNLIIYQIDATENNDETLSLVVNVSKYIKNI